MKRPLLWTITKFLRILSSFWSTGAFLIWGLFESLSGDNNERFMMMSVMCVSEMGVVRNDDCLAEVKMSVSFIRYIFSKTGADSSFLSTAVPIKLIGTRPWILDFCMLTKERRFLTNFYARFSFTYGSASFWNSRTLDFLTFQPPALVLFADLDDAVLIVDLDYINVELKGYSKDGYLNSCSSLLRPSLTILDRSPSILLLCDRSVNSKFVFMLIIASCFCLTRS